MTSPDVVLAASLVIYLAAVPLLLWQERKILGSFTMVSAASAPVIWQGVFTESDAPGYALLFMLLIGPPLVLLIVSIISAAVRLVRHKPVEKPE